MNHRWMMAALVAAWTCGAAPALAAAPDALRIGYHAAWTGQGEIFETLAHTNILQLNGIEPKFTVFAYGGPLGEALVAGDLDVGLAADVPILRAVARRDGWKVVSRTHDWNWVLMARPDSGIRTFRDLRGKRLAAPFGTSTFPRAYRRLLKEGFKDPFHEMTITNLDLAQEVPALQAGSVDAIVTWAPTSEKAVETGAAKVIAQGEPGDGLSWQALGPNVLADRRLAVRYLKSYILAVWWASNHLDQAQRWYAKTSGLSPELLKRCAKEDRYLRAPVKSIRGIDLAIRPSEIREVQGVMDFLVQQNLLHANIDVGGLVDGSLIAEAQREARQVSAAQLAAIRVTAP